MRLPKRRFSRGVLLATTFSVVLAACGSDSNPNSPLPGNGTMTARIDGNNWSATSIVPVSTGGATPIITIGGGNPQTSFGFAWIDTGVGTYTIGQAVGLNANLSTIASQQQWSAGGTTGTGSITVTTRTAERVAGTFSFTLAPVTTSGATGTRTVTNGAFDVRF